jgi:iron complex transport system substrate-binding protein
MSIILNLLFHSKHYPGVILYILVIFSFSCGGNKDKKSEHIVVSGQIVNQAERFRIEIKNGYSILTIINPWQGADNISQAYYLIRRGQAFPYGVDSSMVIFVPLKKIICMSTTHVAMISALGEENTITGISGTGFICLANIIRNINMGLVKDVGYEGTLNKELILNLSPDLVMMYGIGSESAGYIGKIKELGIKVLFNADYLETTPIGKMEWIKLFGALYCKETKADSLYSLEFETYKNLKEFIRQNISSRPKVLLGLPFKDTWYISPGNSYISKIIEDAGGNYLWQNTISSISMPLGIENVYMKALTADYWLNIGTINSKDEISAIDKRLNNLPCYKEDHLFNNNKRITLKGGNDYWESGSLYPHLILRDIASILHPELFNNSELFYYNKIN